MSAMTKRLKPPFRSVVRELGVWDALQWTFGTECAAMDADELGASSGGQRPALSMEAILEQRFMLGGVKIDTSPGRSDPAEDAEVIASVVRSQLTWHDAVWIADLARAGRMPNAMVGEVPRLLPEEWHGNRHGWRGKASDSAELGDQGWRPVPRRNRKGVIVRDEVRYTPCTWTPTASQIGAARRRYLDWWGHLLTLQIAFRSVGLQRIRITRAMPPMTPWLGGAAASGSGSV